MGDAPAAVAAPQTNAATTTAAPAAAPPVIGSGGFHPPESRKDLLAKYSQPDPANDAPADDANAGTPKAKPEAKTDKKPAPKDAPKPPGGKPNAADVTVDSLKALASKGDAEGLFAALGIDPNGLKIPSSRFQEFRKWTESERAKLRTAAERVQSERVRNEQMAQQVVAKFEPLAKGKQAFDDGDVETAVKLIFGTDLEKFTDAAMKQKLGQDPEVVKLRRWKEEQEAKVAQEAEERKQQEAQRQAAEREKTYLTALTEQMQEDPRLKFGCEKIPNFAREVMKVQLDEYRETRVELTPAQAAGIFIERITPIHKLWGEFFGYGLPSADDDEAARDSGGPAIKVQKTDGTGKESTKKPKKATSETSEKPTSIQEWARRMQQAAREDGLA